MPMLAVTTRSFAPRIRRAARGAAAAAASAFELRNSLPTASPAATAPTLEANSRRDMVLSSWLMATQPSLSSHSVRHRAATCGRISHFWDLSAEARGPRGGLSRRSPQGRRPEKEIGMTTNRSRRRFVGTVAAVAGWTSLGRMTGASGSDTVSDTAPAGGKPERLKLGLASYAMREFPLDQALAWAKLMDVKYMTFKDVHVPRTDTPEATRAIRAKIEAAGITIMGGGTITIKNDAAQI